MSRWLLDGMLGPSPSLGLAANELALVWHEPGSGLQQRQAAGSPLEAAQHLVDWMAGSPSLTQRLKWRGLRVTVAEELARWWLVHPPAGTASLAELQAFARLRHEELFGEPVSPSSMKAWWASNEPSVCCAVSAVVGSAVLAIERDLRIRCSEVVPAAHRLITCLPRRGRPEVVVTIPQADRASVWWFDQGRLSDLRSLRLAEGNVADLLGREVTRMATTRPALESLTVLHGAGGAPDLSTLVKGTSIRQLGLAVSESDLGSSAAGVAALLAAGDRKGHALVAVH